MPLPLNFKKFYVVNLDDNIGSHWVLMYPMKNRKKFYYFDSFGGPPPEVLDKFVGVWNHLILQHPHSAACGYYVVYMADQLEKGRRFNDILLDFSPNNENANEKIIYNYFI